MNSFKNSDFLMFLPFRDSGRIPDPALPRDCSVGLRRHPRRLGSETLPLLQRWSLLKKESGWQTVQNYIRLTWRLSVFA